MIPLYDEVPTRSTPFVTLGLIAANIAVFFAMMSMGGLFNKLMFMYGATPVEILYLVDIHPYIPLPVEATVVTSMFIHGDIMHLAGNMLYLWIFGNNVEDYLGHGRFVFFYLFCGAAAVFAHAFQDVRSTVPLVGASGAISGILAVYFLVYPRVRVFTLFWFIFFIRVIPVPAWFLIGVWFLIQISSLGSGGHVAWGAHIGGFIAGFVLFPFLKRRRFARW